MISKVTFRLIVLYKWLNKTVLSHLNSTKIYLRFKHKSKESLARWSPKVRALYGEAMEPMAKVRTIVRTHFLEIINLMDGKRSVLDIRNAVSAEFGEIDLDFVMKYISDLKKFNLVSF